MKTFTLKNQEAQFVYSILWKVRINHWNDLAAWERLISIIETPVATFEKVANKILAEITSTNQDLRKNDIEAKQKKIDEKIFNEVKEAADVSIKKCQEKYKDIAEKTCSFDLEDSEMIDLNWFLSDYIRSWTKYDASNEMRGTLNIPALKTLHKVMSNCSDAIEELHNLKAEA